MKLLRFSKGGRGQFGLLEGESVYEITGSPFSDSPDRGPFAGHLNELRLLAPCEPTKIICAAKNYPWGENPSKSPKPNLFFKPPSSVIGHGEDIIYPAQSKQVIFESELAVVIGKVARNLKAEEARRYILGFTCANDVTAYDFILQDGTTFHGKSFDTFCPLGPVIVSNLDPQEATITCRVNGVVRAKGTPRDTYYSWEDLVCFVSGIMTLFPGDVILTGTPDIGTIQRGDLVEVDITGIGRLRNRLV